MNSSTRQSPDQLTKTRKFRFYNTLSTKLIVAFLAIAILPLSLLAFLNDRAARTALTDAANQALLAASSQTAASLDGFINTNLDAIRTEAQSPTLVRYLNLPANQRTGTAQEAEVTAILRAASRKDQLNILSYALLDRQGLNVIDTYTPDVGLNESNSDYFQMPLQTGLPYISPVELSPTTSDTVLYFASPLRNSAEEIIGVLRVRYSAAVLQQLIVKNNNLAGSHSFAVLFDENHIHLAHGTAPEAILKSVVEFDPARLAALQAARRLPNLPAAELSINLPDLDQKLANAANQPYFMIEDVTTGSQINQVAAATLTTQPWLVAFFQPREVFLTPAETQTRTTLLLAVVIAGIVAGVAIGVGQLLARPITRLTAVAQQITGGNLEARAPVGSQDETGQLAAAFNNMTAQIRHLIGSLEDQVRERTAELALSMEVGQRAAPIRELNVLLPTITEFIREQFNLYYTQVYFVDDLGKNLILKAGTGTVGQELIARHHNLLVGPGSIVGRVAAERRSIVVSDTQNSDIHKANPLLPETRSELAVPLVAEDHIIGVLDMQADKVNTFTVNNMTVFEAMATQLALSIDSAQQWALAQEAQRKSEEAIRQLTHERWAERLASRRESLGFAYDLSVVAPLSTIGLKKTTGEEKLAVPLVVQNEPIGQLAVEVPPQRALSTDEEDLVTAVAQQLAQKAENLRLFEQTEQRAIREQIARQIVDKVRASRNIDSALKTAAEELAKSLGATRAVIDLRLTPEKEEPSDSPISA